jgi:hypothetical protein
MIARRMRTHADAHFVRFARALALGATTTLLVASGCESSAQTQPATPSTTPAESSSGSAGAADAGAGATSPPAETPTTQTAPPSGAIAQGAACATVAQRDERYEPGAVRVCVCSATDAGSAQWQCQTQPARVMGPLPPPELAA